MECDIMAGLKQSYDEHFALIIGINKYDSLNDLEYAVNDAKSIKEVLIQKFSYKEENITLLLDKQATKDGIMDAYFELANKTCNDDSVLIFFAGHGYTYQAGIKDKGFLIPCNGTEQNLNSLISWESLIENADLIRAKHIFYIMDACYSGLILQRSPFGSKRFLKEMLRRYSRQVLTAGKSDQKVKDGGGNTNNSIFTSYLLEALNGEAKTEQGVLSASSVMNYVYNKVSCDPKSYQTPSYGSVFGEGDFIFNADELFNKEEPAGKENDILIDVSLNHDIKDTKSDFGNRLKELLSDGKNFIKVTDIINQELRIYLSQISNIKGNLSMYNEETFKDNITKLQDLLKNILDASILLTYYGDDRYVKLIKKIILRTYPTQIPGGNMKLISTLYFPTLLLYYVIIISAIEANNYALLKEIINLKVKNRVNSNIDLIVDLFQNTSYINQNFSVFFPDENYKLPMNEYIHKQIQAILDDLLFLGDDYGDRYLNTELLLSMAYAIKTYKGQDKIVSVWGRFIYTLHFTTKNIEDLSVNDIANKIDLYDGLDNKSDFIKKYNQFIVDSYF